MHIWQIFIFIFSFIVLGLIFSSWLYDLFKQKILTFWESTILGLGLTPLLISMFLYLSLLVFPSKSNLLYVGLVCFAFLIGFWVLRHKFLIYLNDLYLSLKTWRIKDFKSLNKDKLFIIILVVLVGFYIFYQGLNTPISSNDGSIYNQIGRNLYSQKNLDNYPMYFADNKTGFFWTGAQHAPALPLIYSWNYLLQGGSQSDVLARVVSPLYALYLGLLIYFVVKKYHGAYAGIFSLLLLVSTPIMVWQSYTNSIDPIRFFLFFLSFMILGKLVEFNDKKLVLLLGLIVGMSMYIHLAGLLVAFVVLAVYTVFAKINFKQKLAGLLIIVSIAILTGSIPYIVSFVRFSNISGPNTYSLLDVKVKDFYSPQELVQTGAAGQISVGVKSKPIIVLSKELIFARLQIFSRPELFGLTYYMVLFGIFYWLIKIKKTPMDQVMFLGLLLMTIPIMYKYYLNRRYILMTLPVAIYFGAIGLGQFYENLKRNKKEKWVWIGMFCLLLITILAYFSTVSISSSKITSANATAGGGKLHYLLSNKYEQDRILSLDSFAAIDFINQKTPSDAIILTSDNGRYYAFAQRKSIFVYDPVLQDFFQSEDLNQAVLILKKIGINYIIANQIANIGSNDYTESLIGKISLNDQLSEVVFNGETKVYKLK